MDAHEQDGGAVPPVARAPRNWVLALTRVAMLVTLTGVGVTAVVLLRSHSGWDRWTGSILGAFCLWQVWQVKRWFAEDRARRSGKGEGPSGG